MTPEENRGGNPYLYGALSGLIIVLSVLVSGKYIGASTSFAKSAGMIENLFNAERVAGIDYFIKYKPEIDWQWMFVAGILIGALIASATSGTFKWQAVPDMWEGRFGPGKTARGIAAFLGGAVAMFGARLAGG